MVTGMFRKRPNASPRRILPDSAGLPPGLYATYISIYNEPHSSPGQVICAAPAHRRMIFLHDSSVHHNASELISYSAHRSLPTQLDHTYNINSVTPIYLIIMNNASLSYNSTYVRLLRERTLKDPNFPRHHTRSLPLKAAISHGDHETAKVTPNHCLRTVSCTI